MHDAETGLGYFRARYYDPFTGRFLSEDPIGFAGGDHNWYRYVGNDPINRTDPTGLSWLSEAFSFVKHVGAQIDDFVNDNGGWAAWGIGLLALPTLASGAFTLGAAPVQGSLGVMGNVDVMTLLSGGTLGMHSPSIDGGSPPGLLGGYQGATALDSNTMGRNRDIRLVADFSEPDAGYRWVIPRGIAQGAANILNGVQDIAIGLLNAWNRSAGWAAAYDDEFEFPSPDWSKDLFVENDPLHDMGKVVGGNSALFLAAGGFTAAAEARIAAQTEGTFTRAFSTAERSVAPSSLAPAKRAAGQTVLGHYPEYVTMSEQMAARRFQIPDNVWKRMTEAERWTANQKFLDRTIMHGDEIILSTPPAEVRPGSWFERELQYLMGKGYKPSSDGTRLLPPGVQ